ncbi:MAG TPA: DNA methyltransferase [Polyangiaceae bacterium]|nr:DNA methyltransferase [Polyangiaceae bacterium]
MTVVKRRRSLSHVGGEVERWGDREPAAALAQALDVEPASEPSGRGEGDAREDDPDRVHVHGFHTYPARMHPATAARLVRAFSDEGATVLDPFCGSGTVLVEAMIAGRRAVGTDLNPLAVRLAALKTTPRDAHAREALVAAARTVAKVADERRARRAGATRRYPPEDVATFDPHVLLELDSLRAAVADLPDRATSEALGVVLSAILVKVSRRTSDTTSHAAPRRIAAGYTAKLFVRKTEELARRLAAFEALLPPGAHPARVAVDDATRLRTVQASTVDAVVTSPPYAGTYDYVAHHALRMRWLGLDAQPLAAGELGSRRRYARLGGAAEARASWERELASALRAMARVCRTGARIVLLVADSAVHGEALRADAAVATVAPRVGLEPVARASQRRPHFHAPTQRAFERTPRAEHAILLTKRPGSTAHG